MASEALNWALSNGMTQAEFDRNIFNAVLDAQKNNTSPALLRSEMDRLGITSEDVARATGVTTQSVASQYATALPKTEAELIAAAAAANELAARTARDTTANQSLIDARALAARTATGNLTAAQKAAADAAQLALVARQNEAALALQQRNSEAARLAEIARLAALKNTGGTVTNTGGLLGPTGNMSITGTTPFANATQGFAENFANYQSIPIGAQYNPNVVGGAGSPYSQIMGQMRPVGNPYAGVVAGQAMGGYNPGLYDQIAAANLANTTAEQAAATAAQNTQQESTGMAQGGMVHGGVMFGANPPGPDDGAVNLDIGEYVIKKSSVNKYGRGLLDMINEGKVPAKKMKSLLG
jgi:multidrug efflux pump subunit AcrA (membrane-fusion protein)